MAFYKAKTLCKALELLCITSDGMANIFAQVETEFQSETANRRRRLLVKYRDAGYFKRIVDVLVDNFRSLCQNQMRQKPSARQLHLQVAWVDFVAECVRKETEEEPFTVGSAALDKSAVIHSIGQAVFDCCQANLLQILESESPPLPSTAGARAADSGSGSATVPEEHVLLLTGGGTMGQMAKVLRRRYRRDGAVPRLRRRCSQLLSVLTHMKMGWREKMAVPYIQLRDRGFMYVPRRDFLPFLQRLSQLTYYEAQNSVYGRFTSTIVSETVARVKADQEGLWELFCAALFPQELNVRAGYLKRLVVPHDVLHEFFQLWLRKLTHAQVGQMIRTLAAESAEQKHQRVKGGQNLRSKLYHLCN